MKFIMISLVLLVAITIGVMSNASSIGHGLLVGISEEEGGMEKTSAAFDTLKTSDSKMFVERYQASLKNRWRLARLASVLGDKELFFAVANSTRERYMPGPLQLDESIEHLILEQAVQLEATNQWEAAWKDYRLYIQLFPESKKVPVARAAASKLQISRGFQD